MDFQDLQSDRFLRKDASQNDSTKGAQYAALNPAPKQGDDALRKVGRPKGSEEDNGAPNILTGTVIVSCFIQTSALPSRIEMQGNDLTFFDDTYSQNGHVTGDTSRLIFTHGSAKSGEVISQGFIIEKRASAFNTYDNVLALYALPPKLGRQNVLYVGRDGLGDTVRMNYVEITVNHDANSVGQFPNGVFAVGGVTNGGAISSTANILVEHNSFLGIGTNGYSVVIRGTGGGVVTFPNGIFLSPGVRWTFGAGSPESVVTAGIGSLYSNTSGGTSTTLYVKTSGTGNTGWTAK